ncbi:hypothetical protein K432DRAFT_440101 [Lepidopterella palustris CBS 459.81]|uniref:F-box domain-containing protein n=1 Tax=Lepidopterella palustris CBS 459.81 TaxID=1314670 RepID=A0A8E2EID8_9PEZI|nr:hypothetical protein K432DRAFT_440101 [Lepidopterella palustris CBS 459.81]
MDSFPSLFRLRAGDETNTELMKLPNLPSDILVIVFENLDKQDLIQASLVNRCFYSFAEIFLWREVRCSWGSTDEGKYRSWQTIFKFIQAAGWRPNLLVNVRRLELGFHHNSMEQSYLFSQRRFLPCLKLESEQVEELWYMYFRRILHHYCSTHSQVNRWLSELKLGNLDAYIGMMILCCPQLKELSISHHYTTGSIFIPAALELSATYLARFRSRSEVVSEHSEENSKGLLIPLGELQGFTSIITVPWHPESFRIPDSLTGGLLGALFQLPHLSKLDFWVDFQHIDPPQLLPTLKTLVLRARSGEDLISYSLKELLANTPSLTSLTMFIASFRRRISLPVTLKWLQPVQKTLRTLKFQTDISSGTWLHDRPFFINAGPVPVIPFGPGLVDFVSLTTLETFIPALFSPLPRTGYGFGYNGMTLPPNLKALRLSGGLTSCDDSYWLRPLERNEHEELSCQFEDMGIIEPPRFMAPLLDYFQTRPTSVNLEFVDIRGPVNRYAAIVANMRDISSRGNDARVSEKRAKLESLLACLVLTKPQSSLAI